MVVKCDQLFLYKAHTCPATKEYNIHMYRRCTHVRQTMLACFNIGWTCDHNVGSAVVQLHKHSLYTNMAEQTILNGRYTSWRKEMKAFL